MVRTLLCLILLCDVAACPALCAWQCDCFRIESNGTLGEPACPHCVETSSETESPAQPLHPDCCRTCICKGAVIQSSVQLELDHHSDYFATPWIAVVVFDPQSPRFAVDFAEMPPPVDLGGRFVRIWNCSWLC